MGKFRFCAYFDHGLIVLLIMAGAGMSAVLEVRGVMDALAAGRYGLGSGVAATVPPSVAASSAPRASLADTMLARLSH
ncbi:MAG TPA: hypothetical protein VGK95_09890 [Caldimonas sp.]